MSYGKISNSADVLYPIHDGCNGSLMPAVKGRDTSWLLCVSCKAELRPASLQWAQAKRAHEAAGLTESIRIGRPMAAAIMPKDLTSVERTALRAIFAGRHARDEPTVSLVGLGLATQVTSFVANKIRTIRTATAQGARVAKLIEAEDAQKRIETDPLFNLDTYAPVDKNVRKRRIKR